MYIPKDVNLRAGLLGAARDNVSFLSNSQSKMECKEDAALKHQTGRECLRYVIH